MKIRIKDYYFDKFGVYEAKNGNVFRAKKEDSYDSLGETEKAVKVKMTYVREDEQSEFQRDEWISKKLIHGTRSYTKKPVQTDGTITDGQINDNASDAS